MKKKRPTYQELETRLAAAEPIVEALQHHEVDAVVGHEKISFLLLQEVGEALHQSAAEFGALFDLPGIGMIQADSPSFQFTRVNSKLCAITGFSAAELLTKTLIGLTDPRDRPRAMKELARMIRGQSDSWFLEKRLLCKNGRIIRVAVHGTVLRDDTGRAVRILAMVSDLAPYRSAAPRRHPTATRKRLP